ncbi:alginate O-acetyltransferase AlgX-related protein [Megalodesulfovibrio paquesii]
MNAIIRLALRVPFGLVATLALVAAFPVTVVLQGIDIPTHLSMLQRSMLSFRPLLEWLHLSSLGAAAVALGALVWRSRRGAGWILSMRGWRPALVWLLGLCACMGVASWAYPNVVGDVAMTNLVFDSSLVIFWSLWCLGLVAGSFRSCRAGSRTDAPPRLTWPEKVLGAALCLVFAVETVVTLVDTNIFTMAFVYNTEDQREFSTYREALHGEMFGYPFNSQGYYDKEFKPKQPGSCLVSWIADSFGLGVVPYPWNVATVVEDRLREAWQGRCAQTEVLNFAVPQMGMKGYIQVAQHEAPVYKPDYTVLCIYTLNDITVLEPNILNHSYVQNWRLTQFTLRQLRPYTRPEPFIRLPIMRDPALPPRIDDMVDAPLPAPPHLFNPDLEKPTFPKEVYQERLGQRLRYLDPEKPSMKRQYRLFFQALDYFRKVVGTPLLIVVEPDELQVDDAVWDSLMVGRDASRYVRDLPQQRIREYCERTGQPMVDLLPPLREAQRTQGRVYHLQDTHWNALGNKVAAEAVAAAIQTNFSPGAAAGTAGNSQ